MLMFLIQTPNKYIFLVIQMFLLTIKVLKKQY